MQTLTGNLDLHTLRNMKRRNDQTDLHLHWESGDEDQIGGRSAAGVLDEIREEAKKQKVTMEEIFDYAYVMTTEEVKANMEE